jgi:hypothetical protein
LTKPSTGREKVLDQKTTIALQATFLKAFSRVLPRYPQPVPQQVGTSQNCDKTGICGGYMSRFGGEPDLFSTIWYRPYEHRKTNVGAGLLAKAVDQFQMY